MHSSFWKLLMHSLSHLPLVSHSHSFLSLLQLPFVHFISLATSFFSAPSLFVLHYNFLPVLSSLTTHFLYLYSHPGFSCVLVGHSTIQFSSVWDSSAMTLILIWSNTFWGLMTASRPCKGNNEVNNTILWRNQWNTKFDKPKFPFITHTRKRTQSE